MQKKPIKWATKLPIKKGKGKKKSATKKFEIDSQKVQILAYAHARKIKKLQNYNIQLAEI